MGSFVGLNRMKKLKNAKRISVKILNKQSVTLSQTNVLVQISPSKTLANRVFNVAFSYLKITGSLALAHIKVLLDVHTQLILISRLNEQKGFYKHKCWPTTCAFINLRRCEISMWLYIPSQKRFTLCRNDMWNKSFHLCLLTRLGCLWCH